MDQELNRLGLIDEDEIELDEAALSLALLDHEGTDLAPYRDLLDDIVARVEETGDGDGTAEARAAALAAVLAGEYGFCGDSDTYDDPDNADLIRVIDRRRGLPVSLSILWVATARRLGWEASALNMPGHVLVCVGSSSDGVIIDPFEGGTLVNPARLRALFRAFALPGSEPVIETLPNRAVLVRLLQNQASRAERAGQGQRALELYGRMTTLAPNAVQAWWQRAKLESMDGDTPAARRSLGAILEVSRDPNVRRQVVDTLDSLKNA